MNEFEFVSYKTYVGVAYRYCVIINTLMKENMIFFVNDNQQNGTIRSYPVRNEYIVVDCILVFMKYGMEH